MATGGGISRAGRNTRPTMPVAATDAEPPAPPADLNAEEAAIWHGIIDRMPRDYFAPPTFPMLIILPDTCGCRACLHISFEH